MTRLLPEAQVAQYRVDGSLCPIDVLVATQARRS